MARKRKVRIDRIIIFVLVTLIILGAVGFGTFKLIGYFFNKENKTVNTNEEVVTNNDIKISLEDYKVYIDESDALGFNFIIAKVKFSSNEPVKFDLINLQTSEKIYLNDINKHLNKLELEGYSINKLDINSNNINSQNNTVEVNLFIPYSTDSDKLSVYNSVDSSKLEFDLNTNNNLLTSLKLNSNDSQIQVGTTKVSISNVYISDFMLHNDEECDFGSTVRIYSFEISVLENQDNAQITDAIYLIDGSDYENKALSSDYSSIDMKNIIGEKLSQNTKGGLFFEIQTTDNDIKDGTLLIKFSNENDWIEITNR